MRFVHDNLYPLFATLAIMAAVICWFGAPDPGLPKIQPQIVESWSLPQSAGHDSQKSIDAINTRNLWGIVTADAPKEPVWQVLGIARNGVDQFILLTVDGKPVEMLRVGDTLPNGAKIVQIENDRFFAMMPDKKKLAFGIHKNDQAK